MLTAGTGGIVAADAAPGGCGWTLVPTPPVPGADTRSAAPQAGASIVTPAYGSIVGVDAVAPTMSASPARTRGRMPAPDGCCSPTVAR